jgi:hypothetical protein
MSIENPLWGAPRLHGELLKLGFEIAQSNPVRKLNCKRLQNALAQSKPSRFAAFEMSAYRSVARECRKGGKLRHLMIALV